MKNFGTAAIYNFIELFLKIEKIIAVERDLVTDTGDVLTILEYVLDAAGMLSAASRERFGVYDPLEADGISQDIHAGGGKPILYKA